MPSVPICHLLFLLHILCFIINAPSFSQSKTIETKILNVGVELWEETLPLQMGSRFYLLQGLKPFTWYEVKISYPASIPSSFSIQITRGNSELGLNQNRRLLNTEKLTFKSDNLDFLADQAGMHVLVSVEPAGIVAIPHAQERQFVMFNIVCDELILGVPQKALWVGVLVLLCLGVAFLTPYFLPSNLLRRSPSIMHSSDAKWLLHASFCMWLKENGFSFLSNLHAGSTFTTPLTSVCGLSRDWQKI